MIVPLFIGLLVLATLRSVAADDTGTPGAGSVETTIAVPSPTATVAAPTPTPTEEATATPDNTPEPTPTISAPDDQEPSADSTPTAPLPSPTSAAPDSEPDSVATPVTPSETATADVATPVREEPDADIQLSVTARTESIAAIPGASFTLWYDISNPGAEPVEALVTATNSRPDWTAVLFSDDGATPLTGLLAIPAGDSVTVAVSVQVPLDARVDDHNLTTVDAIVPPDENGEAE